MLILCFYSQLKMNLERSKRGDFLSVIFITELGITAQKKKVLDYYGHFNALLWFEVKKHRFF